MIHTGLHMRQSPLKCLLRDAQGRWQQRRLFSGSSRQRNNEAKYDIILYFDNELNLSLSILKTDYRYISSVNSSSAGGGTTKGASQYAKLNILLPI